MSMQINGNYAPARNSYAEQAREGQAAGRAESAGRAEKPEKTGGAEKPERADRVTKARDAAGTPRLKDGYIPGEKAGQKPSGLYRVEKDESGRRKILYDDPHRLRKEQPEKAADGKGRVAGKRPEEAADGKEQRANGNNPGEPEEKCVGNTDRVEREIRKLKEEKKQLEQKIQSASGDEEKARDLERKLAQVEQELSRKDTDAYSRQNTVFS